MGIFKEWVELQEANAQLGQIIVGVGVQQRPDGLVLVFNNQQNQQGTTSPLMNISSTRHKDDKGRTYYMVRTTSGSNYTVVMDDNVARQALTAFYRPNQQANRQIQQAQQQGRLGGAKKPGSARIIL